MTSQADNMERQDSPPKAFFQRKIKTDYVYLLFGWMSNKIKVWINKIKSEKTDQDSAKT